MTLVVCVGIENRVYWTALILSGQRTGVQVCVCVCLCLCACVRVCQGSSLALVIMDNSVA